MFLRETEKVVQHVWGNVTQVCWTASFCRNKNHTQLRVARLGLFEWRGIQRTPALYDIWGYLHFTVHHLLQKKNIFRFTCQFISYDAFYAAYHLGSAGAIYWLSNNGKIYNIHTASIRVTVEWVKKITKQKLENTQN